MLVVCLGIIKYVVFRLYRVAKLYCSGITNFLRPKGAGFIRMLIENLEVVQKCCPQLLRTRTVRKK